MANPNGAPRAADRNPEQLCGQPGCHAYKITGAEVCMAHGGRLPQVQRAAARRTAEAEVIGLAQQAGAVVPLVTRPEDFPAILAEYVGRFNRVFARLEQELDVRRQHTQEIELSREFSDVLDRQMASATMVTKMIQSAAALGLQLQERPNPAEAAADFLGAMDVIRIVDESDLI